MKSTTSRLDYSLNSPGWITSNADLAAALLLLSLHINFPKTFRTSGPWQQHLFHARSVIASRLRVLKDIYEEVFSFLLRWFSYLDILGRLSEPKLLNDDNLAHGWLSENDYDIDCVMGFTPRCANLLLKVSNLIEACRHERMGLDDNDRPSWRPSNSLVDIVNTLYSNIEIARNDPRNQVSAKCYSKSNIWNTFGELATINKTYYWAGIILIHHHIPNEDLWYRDVQIECRITLSLLLSTSSSRNTDVRFLFPKFIAGTEVRDPEFRTYLWQHLMTTKGLGIAQLPEAREIMKRVWETGRPWDTMVSGEFFG